MNYIYIGSTTNPTFYFADEQLQNVSANMNLDAIGNELSIDTLQFEVRYNDSNGNLRGLQYGTPIFYYSNESIVGKFYFKNIERIGATVYRIDAVSVIGLLEYEKHYGGMYINKNVKEAVEEIIKTDGVRTLKPGHYEYAESFTTADSIDLGTNGYGPDALSSGFTTSIYIKFSILEALSGSEKIIWKCDYAPSDATTYWFQVSHLQHTDQGERIRIAATINGITWGDSFITQIGTVIEVCYYPKFGQLFYRQNQSTRQYSNLPTASNTSTILPLYGTVGKGYISGTTYIYNVETKYRLYNFCLFSIPDASYASITPSSYATKYVDIYAAKNNGVDSFYDEISDTYYNASSYYRVGGNISGGESGDHSDIADNIVWQSGVDALTFSGWIPAGSKRNSLHQILFALNLNLYKTESGDMVIGKLPTIVSKTIDNDEIYESGSTEEVKKPKQIDLTENSYTVPPSSAETKTVFDNSSITPPEGQYIAEFENAPIYGTPTGDGITIVKYNANAALVTGKGKITVKTYTKSTRVITEKISSRPDGDTISVSDASLVTYLTSGSVMDKLKAYYANQVYKIKNAIVGNGELIGRKYTLKTPFNETDSAYLVAANVIGSNIAKINCEFVAGYTPVDVGQAYSHVSLLTGSGTWVVPTGTSRIHVVLIGGGDGGESGYAGKTGSPGVQSESYFSTQSNEGGMYGGNGQGGLIFEVDIENPSGSYNYSCGSGGAGGAICYSHETNNQGSAGGATTFSKSGTTYSSSSGSRYPDGYTDLLSGDTYAAPMPQWDENSGSGGASGWHHTDQHEEDMYIVDVGVTYYPPVGVYNKLTGDSFTGGGIYDGFGINWTYGAKDNRSHASGDGGGAALNQNGYHGTAAKAYEWNDSRGGNGANATYIPPDPTTYYSKNYGSGGMGGCGGGGGGSGGTRYMNWGPDRWSDSTPGTGGYGGRGGNGGNGCILVYY